MIGSGWSAGAVRPAWRPRGGARRGCDTPGEPAGQPRNVPDRSTGPGVGPPGALRAHRPRGPSPRRTRTLSGCAVDLEHCLSLTTNSPNALILLNRPPSLLSHPRQLGGQPATDSRDPSAKRRSRLGGRHAVAGQSRSAGEPRSPAGPPAQVRAMSSSRRPAESTTLRLDRVLV